MSMIVKKDGSLQQFDENKIINAIQKSAQRCCVTLNDNEKKSVIELVKSIIEKRQTNINVSEVHNLVECALDNVNGFVAKAYREYRNYKKEFSAIIDRVYNKKISLENESDRSNANADSSLVTTQKAIVYNELNALLYDKFFLNDEERSAVNDGYIYIHDKGSRYDSINCCLFDMKNVINGGFFMGNLDYNEPKSLDVAFDLIADVAMNAASSQYGGFTIPEVDKLMAPYAELSYKFYKNEFKNITDETGGVYDDNKADEYAYNKVKRDMEQGVQCWEMKFNSVASSRGDYPFTAITFGLGTGRWETLFSSVCMKTRKEGQGKSGFKHPVLFPKLSFFYDENLHGEGKEFEWLFDEAIDCSSKSMYPDFISLTGKGYQGDIYKKYKTPISRMGCISGNEKVIYLDVHNKLHKCVFSEMWKSLSKHFEVHSQIELGFKSGFYMDLQNIKILDANGFVECKRIIRNVNERNWCKVFLESGKRFVCTLDHPFSVHYDDETIVKQAKELFIGDKIEIFSNESQFICDGETNYRDWDTNVTLTSITRIDVVDVVQDSFDVTTESEHFYCSGIRSHNCRAQLAPWYVKGGFEPLDESDYPVFNGRFNMGAITLHFPMIVAKAKKENKDFWKVLDYYLELIRGIHKKTFEYLSHKKAGTNPLGFCQGGFLNGHLDPEQEIGKDFLRPMTISFGVIALNEASILYNGKSIAEDNKFAYDVLSYIKEYIAKIKKEDNIGYALYGVPGETLCHKQIKQFRKKYGIIKDVSDHEYTTNSFHCCVRENITPIEKQNIECDLYHLCTGGNIQYCRYPLQYNTKAIKTLVRRAMNMGFYEGVNLQLDYCSKCGTQFIDSNKCPKCGSEDIVRIERMNGYLGYSKIRGRSMYSDERLKELSERVSM